jgi:hypothetical protein
MAVFGEPLVFISNYVHFRLTASPSISRGNGQFRGNLARMHLNRQSLSAGHMREGARDRPVLLPEGGSSRAIAAASRYSGATRRPQVRLRTGDLIFSSGF